MSERGGAVVGKECGSWTFRQGGKEAGVVGDVNRACWTHPGRRQEPGHRRPWARLQRWRWTCRWFLDDGDKEEFTNLSLISATSANLSKLTGIIPMKQVKQISIRLVSRGSSPLCSTRRGDQNLLRIQAQASSVESPNLTDLLPVTLWREGN